MVLSLFWRLTKWKKYDSVICLLMASGWRVSLGYHKYLYMVLAKPGERGTSLDTISFERSKDKAPNKERLFEKFKELLGEIEEQCGPAGLPLLEKAATRQIGMQEFNKELKELPDFREFQKFGLEYLTKLGLVERHGGTIVVDVEALKNSSEVFLPKFIGGNTSKRSKKIFRKDIKAERKFGQLNNPDDLKASLGKFKNFKQYVGDHWHEFLFNVFKGSLVVSKEEWQTNKTRPDLERKRARPLEPKSLFYSPESVDDAFDVDKIKAAKFYLGPWEIKGEAADNFSPWDQDIPFDEASIAAITYHPNYGAGQRGDDGKVTVVEGDERRLLSIDWLNARYFKRSSARRQRGAFLATPQLALREGQVPHLSEYGLFKPEDFKINAVIEENQRFNLKRPIDQEAGYVVLNDRIRYALGRNFGKKKLPNGKTKYYATQVSDQLGGILELNDADEEKLVATFPILTPDNSGLDWVATSANGGYFQANRKVLPVTEFNVDNDIFVKKKNNETDEEFERRKEAADFSKILEVNQAVVKETKISLQSLTPLEQASFADYVTAAPKAERKKLYSFIEKHGINGARSLAIAKQLDEAMIQKIRLIGEKSSVAEAALVYEKFCELVTRANDIENDVKNFFSTSTKQQTLDTQRVTAEMLKRAASLITEYSNAKKTTTVRATVAKLDQLDADMMVLGSMFKSAFSDRSGNLQLGEVRGFVLEQNDVSKVGIEDKARMIDIFRANREASPDGYNAQFLKKRVAEFTKLLESVNKRFYVLKQNDDVIAFVHFEDLPDGKKYLGSFNVNPSARGSAIGTAFLHTLIEAEGRTAPIQLNVNGTNPYLKNYIDGSGFEIDHTEADYKGSGKLYYFLERPVGGMKKKARR